MRKGILIGIGIFVILLALAGTVSAKSAWTCGSLTYGSCHDGGNDSIRSYFSDIHKFNGSSVPLVTSSCTHCHTNLSTTWLPLTSNGSLYNSTHRYNATTLASEKLSAPACYNCHVNVNGSDFNLSTGAATYLGSAICVDCHKARYDNWTNTMHRVILTSNVTASDMNLVLPPGYNWTTNVSYAIIGKTDIYYLNETGYFKDKKYNTITKQNETAVNYSGVNYSGLQYNCGECHTTGYNATGSIAGKSGIVGNWSEPGIACEECHGAGGNGHNVTVYTKGEDCIRCHDGTNRQGPAMTNRHKMAPAEESTSASCTFCHSPYDNYKTGKVSSAADGANVTCLVCHNPHNTSNDKYGDLLSTNGFNATNMSNPEVAKVSFFNGTASNASKEAGLNASLTAGNDVYDILMVPASLYPGYQSTRKDTNYANESTIDIRADSPVSEVLCSKCHYRHGLAHVANVNLTHGRNNINTTEWATCTDCHMSKAGGQVDHSFNASNATNFPDNTCSKGNACHVTSDQNVSASNISIEPREREWAESEHNSTKWYAASHNDSNCYKCHEPMNWDGKTASSVLTPSDLTFRGIACMVCHNIHDMGDWINNTGNVYAWYNRDAIAVYNTAGTSISRYKANYSVMDNTTELCGNCHSNDNPRTYRLGPGYNQTTDDTPIRPHGWPAKDIFVGSWKQERGFECIDCHMYKNMTNGTGYVLNDTEKTTGHTFRINAEGLQNTSACNYCHLNGTNGVDTIPNEITRINASTHTKWDETNQTVMNALANVTAYTGVKTVSRDKIAEAYWKLKMVSSDGSWGVHDPAGTDSLLDEAAALAIAADASLGQATSNIDLVAGWNLVALNGTPAVTAPVSVLSSVSSNITVAWGYNATSAVWELYDPAMPTSLNSLTAIVPGKGYWIKAIQACEWTV